MPRDPLGNFRRSAPQEPSPQLDEHSALREAIDALNQIPNTRLAGKYKSTYELLRALDAAYKHVENQLARRQALMPMTDAEIEAAVKHDLTLLEQSGRESEPEPEEGFEPER